MGSVEGCPRAPSHANSSQQRQGVYYEQSVIPGGSLMQPGSTSHAPNLGPQLFLITKRNPEKYLKALFFFFSGGCWYTFKVEHSWKMWFLAHTGGNPYFAALQPGSCCSVGFFWRVMVLRGWLHINGSWKTLRKDRVLFVEVSKCREPTLTQKVV